MTHVMRSIPQAAAAGIVGAAVSLGLSELVAGLLPGAPSLVLAIGGAIIDAQPPGAKDLVVALFGTNDKLALEIGIVVVALAVAAGLGVLARTRFSLAAAGFGLAGLAGFVAALGDPLVTPTLAAVNAGLATGAGIQVLSWLITTERPGPAMPDWSRRRFLVRGGAMAVASLAAGVVGRSLLTAQAAAPRAALPEIPPATPAPPLPIGASLDVAGISPLIVPNDDFYRIDTALIVPRVDLPTWAMRVHGMVDREVTLSYEQLLELSLFEQYVTIACVSNEVGGDLVGNAKWTGARLADVLDMAGVQPGASQLVGRSVDGWTGGFPTAWLTDHPEREAMIAVAMNDEPLPIAHGFPARLIVPGLYGYVSATKWLSEVELTTLEAFDAYWVPLGWAKEAPILTQSRIDTPRNGASVTAGRVAVAGVAWAPDRGISTVEVAVDGDWAPAVLSTPVSGATWLQWRFDWQATPGDHEIAVRATDGPGETQTELRSPPAPDGARGWHTIRVRVA